MKSKITLTASNKPQADHKELAAQGREFFNAGQPAKAQQVYVRALLLNPTNKRYKNALTECLPYVKYQQFNSYIKQAILFCLDDPDIAHRKISGAWLSQFLLDPKMAEFTSLLEYENYEVFLKSFNPETIHKTLNDDFFLKGIKKCLLMHPAFERILTYLRRFYLLEASESQKEEALPFLCALALKCFNNDYIYDVSSLENKTVKNLPNQKDLSLADFIIIGCYLPLYKISEKKNFSVRAHKSNSPDIKDLGRVQIDEPILEKQLVNTIETFSLIDNEISSAVQDQYEEHPYPRWVSSTKPTLTEGQLKQSINKDVLVAGCGTGQEVTEAAFRMPNAEIDAVDLSRASLGYALRKTQSLEIDNIRFLHGDLLNLKALNKTYDFILSSGVLHHMENPQAGLQSLKAVLKPGGIISVSLYSEIGREHIAACQKWVKEQGYAPTTAGMRQFRQDIFSMDDTNPLKSMTSISDFYSGSECRDLIFHVQEHRFTCLGLKEMIEALDLSLLNMGVRAINRKKQYLEQYPDDPKAINLENWHEFEQQNPRTFTLMYDLVLGRQNEHKQGELPEWIKVLDFLSH